MTSKKDDMPWYARNCVKFLKKTGHLSMMEMGAYDRMLDWYYTNRDKRGLPTNVAQINRICGAFVPDECEAVLNVLGEFFHIVDGRYINDTAQEEIDKAEQIGRVRRDAQALGVQNKAQKGVQNGVQTTPQNPPQNPPQIGSQTAPQNHHKKNTSTSTSEKKEYNPPYPPNKLSTGQKSEVDVFKFEGGRLKFSIEAMISDDAIMVARAEAPGWDIYHLMGVYDQNINEGTMEAPRSPNAAFPAWCKKYTKGKPPK